MTTPIPERRSSIWKESYSAMAAVPSRDRAKRTVAWSFLPKRHPDGRDMRGPDSAVSYHSQHSSSFQAAVGRADSLRLSEQWWPGPL